MESSASWLILRFGYSPTRAPISRAFGGQLRIEKDLLDVLGGGRGARIAARYHGFDGGGGESLQSVGDAFGVTRERIRQIVAAASANLRTERPVAPALDRTIAFVADRIPASPGVIDAGVIEAQMRSKGLTAGLFRIEQARGVSNWSLVASVLARERSLRWLDSSREWFWLETGINPVLHRIRKILAVVSPIHASDLSAGIARSPRMKGFSPPIEVLLEFCRQAPGLHVRDNAVEANHIVNPNKVLSHIERQIVQTLSQNGGTLTMSALKSVCLRMGLNQTTGYLYLVRSPFISKHGHNRYRLIGSGEKVH